MTNEQKRGPGRPPVVRGAFGSALFHARTQAGMRVADVASLVDASASTVARWERGVVTPTPFRQRAILAAIEGKKLRGIRGKSA